MFQSFQAPEYAGFWIRLLAYLIDAVLMMVVFCPVGLVLGAINAATGADENSAPNVLANAFINVGSIVVGWLYSSLTESSSWQGTVGKKLLGLKVTDMDGNRIGFGKATGRYFGQILSSLICGFGFIMIAFSEKKQGLHDMLAGTLVVKGQSNVITPPPPPSHFGYDGGKYPGDQRWTP